VRPPDAESWILAEVIQWHPDKNKYMTTTLFVFCSHLRCFTIDYRTFARRWEVEDAEADDDQPIKKYTCVWKSGYRTRLTEL
jgi:hypothetical protein